MTAEVFSNIKHLAFETSTRGTFPLNRLRPAASRCIHGLYLFSVGVDGTLRTVESKITAKVVPEQSTGSSVWDVPTRNCQSHYQSGVHVHQPLRNDCPNCFVIIKVADHQKHNHDPISLEACLSAVWKLKVSSLPPNYLT